jgi:hypothetical protein
MIDRELAPVVRGSLEIWEYVLDEDYAGIDDDAEIDRTDRQQICRIAGEH